MADKDDEVTIEPREHNYTQAERFKKLADVYDNGLDFLERSSHLQVWKGTSAVIAILLGVRSEITGLPEMTTAGNVTESKDITVTFEKAYPAQVSAEA